MKNWSIMQGGFGWWREILTEWLLGPFKQHHLLYVILDGVHTNTFTNTSVAMWVVDKKSKGLPVVVVNSWEISWCEYMSLKNVCRSKTPNKK